MNARSKKRRSTGPAVSFKKRIFRGNQFIESPSSQSVVNDNSAPRPVPSTSRRKIEGSINSILDEDNGMLNLEDPSSFHYILINIEILSELFTLVGCCPDCAHRGIVISNEFKKKKGLANCLTLSCSNCEWTYSTYTSRSIEKPSVPGMNAFDINVRSVVAFREIGKGIRERSQMTSTI